MAYGDDEDISRRGSTVSSGMPVRMRSARLQSEDDGDLKPPPSRRNRAHLVTEACQENEELHARISMLEDQLEEEKEKNQAQDGDRAVLEAEVTRLRELYEPKGGKLEGKQKQQAMSAIDQMSHDVKMRDLHERIEQLHTENDKMKHDLQDAKAAETTAEEELDELKRDNKKLKDQIKIVKVERDKHTTAYKQLETRFAETQAALRDATEKAQRAEAAHRALADDMQAERARLKHKSNGEHAKLAVARTARPRGSSNHVDSLADELGNSSSWFNQWNDAGSEAPEGPKRSDSSAGLELTDMASEQGSFSQAPEAAAPIALEVGPPPAALRGFIEKKSPSVARFMPCRPFQRRLFVLECGRFSWYDPGQDPSSAFCKGSLDFVFNPSVVEEDGGDPDSFSIRPVNGLWVVGGFTGASSGRVLEFRCCDPSLPRARWLEALKAHAEFGLRSHEAMLPLAEALGRHGPVRSPLLGEARRQSALAAPPPSVPAVTVTQVAGPSEERAKLVEAPAPAAGEAEPEAALAAPAAEEAKPEAVPAAPAAGEAKPEDMPVVSAQS